MVSANLGKFRIRQVSVRTGLVLAILLLQTGCAQLTSYAKKDWPSVGSKESAQLRAERTPGQASKGDLYARSLSKGSKAANSALASRPVRAESETLAAADDPSEIDRVSATESDIAMPKRSRSKSPVVTLQAPEELPPLPDAERIANQVPKSRGWSASQPPPSDDPEEVLTESPSEAPEVPETIADEDAKPLDLHDVLAQSRTTLDGISTYQVQMDHQERVNGELNAPDHAVLSIRRDPKATRIEWRDGPNKGREVLFVNDEKGGMMHVHMANSLIPTLTMSPNSPLATRNSRHPISEAGLDTILAKMEEALKAQDSGDNSFGKITYEGEATPEGLGKLSHKILRVTPTGERWLVYIDSETNLPDMVQANDPKGDLLERYLFLEPKLEPKELSEATAFNPETRWGTSKGLFSRLARGAAAQPASESR